MRPDRSRIIYLLTRYRDNTCSKEEFAECISYISEKMSDPVLMEWMEEEWLFISGETWEVKNYDHLYPDIHPVQTLSARIIPWLRASAAAVFLLLVSGIFLYHNARKTKTVTRNETMANNDAAPGGNKAVLTLGNGSKIILDSARKGFISQQGNTNIVKTDSGELVYHTLSNPAAAIAYNTMSTPRGGQYQLVLSDGTKVWLNAASSITYPTAFAGRDRKVSISGEVYFEVVHDASRPFKVSVNGLEIEDLGTRFNINAYPDENSINTTLIEGSVKIKLDKKEKLLNPGEEAQLNPDGKISIIRNADIKKIMAWKNGEFRFNGDDLESAMRQISRWYDVDVVNDHVQGAHLTGVISRNVHVSEVFKMLELTGVVHFTIVGKTVTVLKVN